MMIIETNLSAIFVLIGGYFQTRSGQVSKAWGGIGCEFCTNGTFVSPDQSPGRSPKDCEVCPAGTDKNRFAGSRACYCLDGYFRKDRFGHCMICPEEGIICSDEHQQIKPGFWWTWNFCQINDSALNCTQNSSSEYKEFVNNLLNYGSSYDIESTRFDGVFPKPFPCLHGTKSCPAIGGIDESCGKGYEGWLCSKCSSGYYSWFEYCVKCPSLWHFILELLLFVTVTGIIVAIAGWDIKSRKKNKFSRSLVYILIARFKIVLGYYQIAGAIFTSLHDINWPEGVSNLASVFRALELNVFKFLAKPQCYIQQLQLNIYKEFVIGLTFCGLLFVSTSLVYLCKFVYLHIKLYSKSVSRNELISRLKGTKSNCYLFLVLMLFITYLSLCDVILALMPAACQEFCIDQNNAYCTERLRSDYSIDCLTQTHRSYTLAAYVSLLYVLGFPLCLFILLFKTFRYGPKRRQLHDSSDEANPLININENGNSNMDTENHLQRVQNVLLISQEEREETGGVTFEEDTPSLDHLSPTDESFDEDDNINMDSETLLLHEEREETESVGYEEDISSRDHLSPADDERVKDTKYPLYVHFLCENYKPEYWYWEIVELSRKLLQTSLVVLYGSADPLTMGANIALSMVFITSHAYWKPMKDPFEHWLQMCSLVAIFLNLLSAEVLLVPYTDPSGYRQTAMAVFIIGLNVSVVLLALGKCDISHILTLN